MLNHEEKILAKLSTDCWRVCKSLGFVFDAQSVDLLVGWSSRMSISVDLFNVFRSNAVGNDDVANPSVSV